MTRAKSKQKAGAFFRWVIGINLFFIFLLFLTYVTPYVSVKTWGWLSILTLAYPFIMMVNGLFAAMWLWWRPVYALLSLIVLLIGFGHHTRYVKLISLPHAGQMCEESIRVMTYNMRGLSLVGNEHGTSVEKRIDLIYDGLNDLTEFPDILCVQEGTKGDLIAKKFDLPHKVHATKSTLYLFSKYPIIKSGELIGTEKSPSCLWADIKTPQGVLRVYNMHLVSNRITRTTEELIEDMNLKSENTFRRIRFILKRYKTTTEKRASEAYALREHMKDCTHPAIVLGDGNDPPLSNTYHILANGLKDSFKESGFGLSTTYDSRLPLLRIDYILGSKEIRFKDHETHHLTFSDHYPVSAGICIRPKTSS